MDGRWWRALRGTVIAGLALWSASAGAAPDGDCVPNRDHLLGALDRHCATVGDPAIRVAGGSMRARLLDCRAPGQEQDNGEYDGSIYIVADPADARAHFELNIRVGADGTWLVDRLDRVVDQSRRALGACGSARRRGLRAALAAQCDVTRLSGACQRWSQALLQCGRWLPASEHSDGSVSVTTPDPAPHDAPGGRDRHCRVTFKRVERRWQVVDQVCCTEC